MWSKGPDSHDQAVCFLSFYQKVKALSEATDWLHLHLSGQNSAIGKLSLSLNRLDRRREIRGRENRLNSFLQCHLWVEVLIEGVINKVICQNLGGDQSWSLDLSVRGHWRWASSSVHNISRSVVQSHNHSLEHWGSGCMEASGCRTLSRSSTRRIISSSYVVPGFHWRKCALVLFFFSSLEGVCFCYFFLSGLVFVDFLSRCIRDIIAIFKS